MKRYVLIVTLALAAILVRPSEVHAESCGLLEFMCLLGISDIADRDAQRREHENALKVQGKTQQTQINADRDLKIAEAEKILQAQIANGKITVELARIQMDSFKAQLDNDAKIQSAMITGQSMQNIAALQGQAQIAVAGVQESGLTVREKMKIEFLTNLINAVTYLPKLLFFFLLFVVSVKLLRRQATQPTAIQTIQAPVQPSTQNDFDEYQNEFYPITVHKKGEVIQW